MHWHEHIRRAIKETSLALALHTGLLATIRRRYMRGRAVILMYHRVRPDNTGVPDYSPNGMAVTPEEFHWQMRFLRRHYDVVPLSKIILSVAAGHELPPNMCAITFDDGWRDNFEHAFPVLRDMSLPATVFLTTGYVSGSAWALEERARYLIAVVHAGRMHLRDTGSFQSVRQALIGCSFGDLIELHPNRLPRYVLHKVNALSNVDAGARERTIQVLEEAVRLLPEPSPTPFLDWQQVLEMARYGIEFGNHSKSHPALPKLTDDAVEAELADASLAIREHLGLWPRYFAYPYGKFDERVRDAVRRQGFVGACTTRIGPVHSNDDVHSLNRINIASDVACSEALFAGRLLGL